MCIAKDLSDHLPHGEYEIYCQLVSQAEKKVSKSDGPLTESPSLHLLRQEYLNERERLNGQLRKLKYDHTCTMQEVEGTLMEIKEQLEQASQVLDRAK